MCKVSKSVIYEFIFVLLQDALTDGSCELVCSDLSSQLTVDIEQLGVVSTVRSGACHLELNCFIFVFTQFFITVQRKNNTVPLQKLCICFFPAAPIYCEI